MTEESRLDGIGRQFLGRLPERVKTLSRPGIGRRLAILILAFSSVVTLLSTALQLTLEYRRDVNDIELRLEEIRDSYQQSLANSLWVTSNKDLLLQLEGILRLPDMQYLEVRSETDAVVAQAGEPRSEQVISRVIPLNYRHLDKLHQLGTLRMVASLDGVYQRLVDKIVVILVTQGVKTFLVSFFILFLFYQLVGRYLGRIAGYASWVGPSQLNEPLDLGRPVDHRRGDDELDLVARGINEMRLNLNAYIRNLAESEQHLAVTLDSIGDAVITTDASGRVTGMNPTAQLLTGWSREHALGRPLDDVFVIINSQSRQLVASPVEKVLTTGVIVGLANHTALLSRNGAEYQIADSAAPIRDQQGTISGVVLVFHDVTEEYRVQQAVEQFKATLDQTQDSVLMFYADDMRIFYVNEGTCRMLGYTRDELMQMRLPDVSPKYTADEFRRRIDARIARNEMTDMVSSLRRHKDGRVIPVEVAVQFVRPEYGRPHYILIARDISERMQVEAEQRIAATAFLAQEGISVADADGLILRTNPAFSEMTGYSPDEVRGKTLELLDSGHDNRDLLPRMLEALRSGGAWSGEILCRRKSGAVYPEWRTMRAVRDESGVITNLVCTHTDITQRKKAEEEISRLAFYDPLTMLPNRRLLIERVGHELVGGARSQRRGALIFLDLDNFKILNDTQGHDVGDQLLVQVANRLRSVVRESDTVARLGGDEFVVMVEDRQEGESAIAQIEAVAQKIRDTFLEPFSLEKHSGARESNVLTHVCTCSIGIAMYTSGQDTVEDLLKRSDMAMYQAKSAGRNSIRFFDPQMQALLEAHTALEADMREALHKHEFLLFYQPQVDDRGAVIGAEALVRWRHPARGMVSPGEFIPMAEETGLILPLGRWVLEAACVQLVEWAGQIDKDHLTVAVNVSARQFRQPGYLEEVREILVRTGAPANRLKLELTESMLVDDVEDVIEKMIRLRALGVGFSLDDFGTGYSSLSYLKRLPLDQLKIDASFVRDLLMDKDDAAIVRTIVVLGESMGISVIAEGVETEGQRDFLGSIGCHQYQGYLFGRPGPAQDIAGRADVLRK